jgi:hypothetical protein
MANDRPIVSKRPLAIVAEKRSRPGNRFTWKWNRSIIKARLQFVQLHRIPSQNMSPAPIHLPVDPVIEAYKRDVDRTLLRENLKLTVEQRLRQHQKVAEMASKLRKAGCK